MADNQVQPSQNSNVGCMGIILFMIFALAVSLAARWYTNRPAARPAAAPVQSDANR